MSDDRIYYCLHCFTTMVVIYEDYVSCLICGRGFNRAFYDNQKDNDESKKIVAVNNSF
jgi:hypothetical protein